MLVLTDAVAYHICYIQESIQLDDVIKYQAECFTAGCTVKVRLSFGNSLFLFLNHETMCCWLLKNFPRSHYWLIMRTEFINCFGTVTPEAIYSKTSTQTFFGCCFCLTKLLETYSKMLQTSQHAAFSTAPLMIQRASNTRQWMIWLVKISNLAGKYVYRAKKKQKKKND